MNQTTSELKDKNIEQSADKVATLIKTTIPVMVVVENCNANMNGCGDEVSSQSESIPSISIPGLSDSENLNLAINNETSNLSTQNGPTVEKHNANSNHDCIKSDKTSVPLSDNVLVEQLITKLDNTNFSTKKSTEVQEQNDPDTIDGISYVVYESEKQMPDIMRLITKDLSEPYSIYTYRYFIHNWPKLCFLAMDGDVCIGAIVCKLDIHKKMVRRGYIAMLAVDSGYRRRKLGSTLVRKAIQAMIRDDCDEVVLETEITNQAALRLYENLGFVRDKRLFRYYLNGVDALRLKLWLR